MINRARYRTVAGLAVGFALSVASPAFASDTPDSTHRDSAERGAQRRRPGRRPRPADAATSAAPASPGPSTTAAADSAPTITPRPLAADESLGNRVAQARSSFDQLEFVRVLELLAPLQNLPNLPAALGVEAALLETNSWVALRQDANAVEACRRAVALGGYNPNVARDQSPRVQALCATAAEQARNAMVATRRIALSSARILTGTVAWNPVRVEMAIDGDLNGLSAQAEVTVGTSPPVLLNLPPSASGPRVATIDSNLAAPGTQISVRAIVRDEYGVLVRAATPTTAMIPTQEAAVRFAQGSDVGPLRVDGAPTSERAAPGQTVFLSPGNHTLQVRSRDGVLTEARVTLRRGEVALVTLRGVGGVSALAIGKWGSTAGAVLLLGTGAVFQFLAFTSARELERDAMRIDMSTGLPLIRYSDIQAVDASRQQSQSLAIGFLAGGGVLAAVAITLWSLPSGRSSNERPTPRAASGVHPLWRAIGVGPTGLSFGIEF